MSAEGRFHLPQFAHFGTMQHAEQTSRWHGVAKLCVDCKRDQQAEIPPDVAIPSASIETKSSWAVASAALFILGMSFGAAWITAVALKDIANEVDGTRSVPALASAPE